MNLKNCWLTINRACNLRCEWCYARETYFQKKNDMSIEMVDKLVEMCVLNGISHFIIIGGEPTIHPQFFEILDVIRKKDCKMTIVTNGLRLADEIFCKQLSEFSEIVHISVSLKGSSDDYYYAHCGAPAFSTVLEGLDNCKKHHITYSLTYVVSSENVSDIDIFAREIRDAGISDFIAFSFCNETIQPSGTFDNVYAKGKHPLRINNIFNSKCENLDKILDGKFSLHQTLPLCMCDETMLYRMIDKNQITTSCHVHNRQGIIFDTNGSILLCNHFVGFGIGKFGVDYYDATTLASFWKSPSLTKLHRMLVSMPSNECAECERNTICGGGCCIQWFSQSFEDYQQIYKSISTHL